VWGEEGWILALRAEFTRVFEDDVVEHSALDLDSSGSRVNLPRLKMN